MIRVWGSKPKIEDSITTCMRSSLDIGEKTPIKSQEMQTSDDSSQSNTFEIKEK